MGFVAVFLSKTLQITQPPSTQMSPGNESPVKQLVTTEPLSAARALGAITTKPVTEYSCSKANLHTREKQGGAGGRGMEMLDKRSSGES